MPCHLPSLPPSTLSSFAAPRFEADASSWPERSTTGDIRSLHVSLEDIRLYEELTLPILSPEIPHLDAGIDIRAVWEPARLQHVSALLHFARLNPTADHSEQYQKCAKDCLMQWLARNPFLYGPHYISAMECALRLPVFVAALQALPLAPTESSTTLSAIYHHAWWIEKRLSLHSSLGNHTVCEAMGLVFAGAVFREGSEGSRWLNKGLSLLRQELPHQVLPDGGPVEQSLNYHRFVLDIYWLTIDLLENNGLSDCSDLKPRLMQGEQFLSAFLDDRGSFPAIGDSDDGHAVAPGMAPKRGNFSKKKCAVSQFPDSGYSVLRSTNGWMMTFDHGPLGMPPLYNHGHADALSITLSINGEQLLVDPGTYRYNGELRWRSYFKGTRAHNTVNIDSLDQAVQETGFIWSKPFKSELLRLESAGNAILLEAINDGYRRLREGVTHKRLLFLSDQFGVLIKDSFSGKGVHHYELNFHLHPQAAAAETNGWWHIKNGNAELFIRPLDSGGFRYLHGLDSPIIGWYSPSYGVKEKCGVLQQRRKGTPDEVSFVTLLTPDNSLSLPEVQRFSQSL